MSSNEPWAVDDVGLLSPAWAGSAVAAATGDAALLRAMLEAEAALVRARAELGLAPAGAAAAVTEAVAASAEWADPRSLALRARSGGNPVIPLVADLTAAVAARSPRAGTADHVHRGATSQDILDTAMMLVAARALDLTVADLDRAATALAALAVEHRDTVLAGRTLTQHAVPTTLGLKAVGWRSLLLAARDRLAAVRAGLPAQLGGAAGTLAAFQSDAVDESLGLRLVTAYARQTGLAEPLLPWHTLRTPVADLGAALAFTGGVLGKLAADVLTLARTEIGELSEGSGGESSAMPHKSNPVRAALIAATARQLPALAGILFGSMTAEDERPAGAWHAEWQPLREALRLAGGAAGDAAELVEGLRVHPERMRENLDRGGGLIAAERLAAALAPLIGRGEARAALARAARRVVAERTDLARALRADPALTGLLSEQRLRELTDPARCLGSAGALVDRALQETL
ncbi:3-carboxy-cis,cis-muconate cycloisomerase [Streptacidiphilus sp. N1-3]|uniref:3-carboxy-cis,cis-muconate cycloisomerase n=1 Tax=Streptacidiphilus alkalitolerans TaxID=3342712 RepID=A0ABV6X280_9ACTN